MMTKEQLAALPTGTKVMFTGEDGKGTEGRTTSEGSVLWSDGVETHFGWRSVPAGTMFSMKVA